MKKFCSKKMDSCSFYVALCLMCISIFSVSCKMTAEGIQSASDDVATPVLLDFSQNSADRLFLSFTEKVQLSDLEVRLVNPSALGDLVFSQEQIVVTEENKRNVLDLEDDTTEGGELGADFQLQVVFTESQQLEMGATYIFSGVAHDQEGNSLLFQLPFYGFNRSPAGVVLSEVRTEASNVNKDNARIEFVELYVHTSGNLAGISLSSAIDEKKYGEYVFPQAEVEAGEYILVHFRTVEEYADKCIDETDSNLNASTSPDSCSDVRDFWVLGADPRLGKDDAIVLRQRSAGLLMDVLLYARSDISGTAEKALTPVAQALVAEGGWSGGADISTWVVSDGLAATRTLSRQNIPEIQQAAAAGQEIPVASKKNWFVVATSCATPGLPNSTTRYTK